MNLIVTCPRHLEPEAREEIGAILKDMGDETPLISITVMPGILTVETGLDPLVVTHKTRERLLEEPWYIRYCLRLIPIQKTTKTDLAYAKNEIRCVMNGISKEDTYRISIEKRNSDISSKEWISEIASMIPNKVSLENPDKIVLVEIIGDTTGVAVIPRNGVLSVEKTKRSLSE